MIEVRLDVVSDYVYVHVVYTQTWTYDEALKAPKIRTSLDEPIVERIISTAKTGRGTCTECGAKIDGIFISPVFFQRKLSVITVIPDP